MKLLEQRCQTHSVLRATLLLYGPDSIENKFKLARLFISGLQTFLSAGTGNQLIKFGETPATQIIPIGSEWYYLEITSPGNNLQKWCNVVQIGAGLKKRSLPLLP